MKLGAILDPRVWKVTLPIGSPGKPTEHTDLASVAESEWLGRQDGGLRFRAPVTGVTTSGSKYPRSELREMDGRGGKAEWSTTSGYHRMEWEAAFVVLPKGKPHVVGAQIHGGSDDVTVWRLESNKLYVTNGDNAHFKLIDPNYKLGTKYKGRIEVRNGVILHYYNDQLAATVPAKDSTCYFKAGCYTQANCTNASPCSADNYGETVVYGVKVTHSTQPLPEPGPITTPQPEPVPEPPMSEFEKDSRARWPAEQQLEADLRGDLHIKAQQLDRIERVMTRIEDKLDELLAKPIT